MLELFPGFSLFRGLHEFAQAAFHGNGMKWGDLSESGMDKVFYIMLVEWFVTLTVAYFVDQVLTSGKSPCLFTKKTTTSLPDPSVQSHQSSDNVLIDMEKADVTHEVCTQKIAILFFFSMSF